MRPFDESALRSALRDRSEVPSVPAVPIEALLSGGRRTVRVRRTRWVGGIGVAAAALVVAAVLTVQADDSRSPGPVDPSPSRPTEAPRTLADLPRGDLPGLPYSEAGTVYVAGGTVDVEGGDPVLSVGGDGTVVLWTSPTSGEPGSLRVVDRRTGDLGSAVPDVTSRPVVSADGRLAAWSDTNPDGTARVRVWDLERGSMVGSIAFPFTPTCCDNPFGVVGIDGQGNLYGAGGRRTWMVPAVGNHQPQVVEGLGGSVDLQVTEVDADRLVVLDGLIVRVGHVDVTVFVDDVDVPGTQGTVSPDGARLAYLGTTRGRSGAAAAGPRLDQELRVRELGSGAEREMRLPHDVTLNGWLAWESSSALLVPVQGLAGGGDRDAWVRCYADSGRCELATRFQDAAAAVPRR